MARDTRSAHTASRLSSGPHVGHTGAMGKIGRPERWAGMAELLDLTGDPPAGRRS